MASPTRFISQRSRPWRGGPRWLALALASTVGTVGTVQAAPASDEGVLHVDVDPGIEDAERLPGWVAERHPDLTEQLADAPGASRSIRVEIEGQYLDYRFRVVALRDGQPVGPAAATQTCECSSDDLLAAVDKGIADAVQRLQEPEATQEGTAEPDPGTEHAEQTDPTAVESQADYRRISGLGVAGVVVGGLGVGGVAAGATMLVMGQRVPDDYSHLERDFGPPGIGALAGGAVLLATGVGLLVTDMVQCKRRHARCARDGGDEAQTSARAGESRRVHVRVAPWAGPRGFGVAGRF